ncbi:DNA-processing protein DprA [Paenactinomyces guangxiensis]|uniref:DNA-protecting protein DprA n=1 Tax=Paenactinomyces guangxiensis TaxID=1490290 RepID=A0A7W2A944_9BACL|nr:DNA-processing protein DprA [Paenactinomyces guangxiensis]MBA4496246.1 DNA-protecting protein DprA [Paenactinomyces guangxiensis]MBH8593372.1 DNA-protecting protein DprA [Paenactinomyces guangxiensis]
MNEQAGLVAMHQIAGVGWHTIDKLRRAGWSPDQDLTPSIIDGLAGQQVSQKTVEYIRTQWTPAFIKKVTSELKDRGIAVLTPIDEKYPGLLKEIAQPPWVLYIKGDIELLSEPCLAVVGTRKSTPYGLRVTRILSEQITRAGWVLVSGMANGIDGEAHRSALKAEGKTIAVLGTGVDVMYPKNHRSLYEEIAAKGAVISEMPPGTQPAPGLFPQRNRIISGLSVGTVVVEAAGRSGSLITANFSIEQGREVFAVPGPITSPQSRGTLSLIQQGAKCVIEAEDIFEEFTYNLPCAKEKEITEDLAKVALSEQEREILRYIQTEPVQITTLMEKTAGKMTVGEVHQTLLSLEIKQEIAQLPGSYYIRK